MSKRDSFPIQHTVVATPALGPRIFSIVDPRTGREVARAGSLEEARAMQAKYDADEAKRDF